MGSIPSRLRGQTRRWGSKRVPSPLGSSFPPSPEGRRSQQYTIRIPRYIERSSDAIRSRGGYRRGRPSVLGFSWEGWRRFLPSYSPSLGFEASIEDGFFFFSFRIPLDFEKEKTSLAHDATRRARRRESEWRGSLEEDARSRKGDEASILGRRNRAERPRFGLDSTVPEMQPLGDEDRVRSRDGCVRVLDCGVEEDEQDGSF